MDQQQLAQLDQVCERLYTSQNAEQRREAEAVLAPFATLEGLERCLYVLECSSSSYSQHMATSSLKKMVLYHWQAMAAEKKTNLRLHLLNFLASKGTAITPFVRSSLVTLLSSVIKLGWLDSEDNREVVTQLLQYAKTSVEHAVLGLHVLQAIVTEMSSVMPHRSTTNNRKIALSFRNTCLLPVFTLATSTLTSIVQGQMQVPGDRLEELCDNTLKLNLACLSYDFIGTNVDDGSEELGTIQIPTSWRETIESGNHVQLYFDAYFKLNFPCTSKAMQCIVQMASIRQSLFAGDTERQAHLASLLANASAVMRTSKGLDDAQKFHELCRLLCRLKSNFQISMLAKADGYQEWIALTANLTITSFQSWQWSNNSIFYLLNLWSRMVASMPYLKGEHSTFLDVYVPRITEAYITARLQSVQTVLEHPGQCEDPLEDEDQVLQELENLAPLCRFNYQQVGTFLSERLAKVGQEYSSALRQPNSPMHLQLYEGQLAWLVYIVSLVIGSQTATGSESHELVDGTLAGEVFKIIMADNHAQQRQQLGRAVVDMAFLVFLKHFRKKHIGDHALSSSKVYTRLRDMVMLSDHLMVMEVIINRVVTNCKVWAGDEDVIRRTLEILSELACGYSSSKMLLKIQAVHFILQNHSPDHFPFLLEPANTRHRTTFYHSLTRLAFLEENTQTQFEQFVAPITQTLRALASVPPHMWGEDAKRSLIGVFRDVRGIFQACVTKRTYMTVFDWLHPTHFPLLAVTAQACYADPKVMVALLKCLAECVHNRAQRMTFDPSSPNGILLFRETSKVLVAYANGVLSTSVVQDVYQERYKGIGACFQIMARVMQGSYVNFGVFELYGDKALADALQAIINMFLSIPVDDLMSYSKVSTNCFGMLELLFRHHGKALVELDTPVFAHICTALLHGLRSPRAPISTHCAASVDSICALCFKHSGKDTPTARHIARHLQANPDAFPSFMTTIFNMVMFEEVTNQWSMSRPLLGLILLNEGYYNSWRDRMVASQPQSQQAQLQKAFEELMQDITCNLEVRNRDKFTQALTIFRHNIKQFM